MALQSKSPAIVLATAFCLLASFPSLAQAEGAKPSETASKSGVRAPDWAVPLVAVGVPNLHKVNDQLYRSAQPSAAEFKALEKLGIKTVLNLRANHDDNDEAKGSGLKLERIEVNTWNISEDEVVEALAILANPENGPFLVHCQHGADRTGLVCAMYRIVNQGWSKEKAIDELKNGGYGFHSTWKNIPKFIEQADPEKLKKAVAEKAKAKKKSPEPPTAPAHAHKKTGGRRILAAGRIVVASRL